MSDQPPLTVDAVEVFVASLRQRSVPINTIKSYAHDLRLFVQSVPADLPAVTAETIQEFLATFGHLRALPPAEGAIVLSVPSTIGSFVMGSSRRIRWTISILSNKSSVSLDPSHLTS